MSRTDTDIVQQMLLLSSCRERAARYILAHQPLLPGLSTPCGHTQVFPDEFHLKTLELYLKTISLLEPKVDTISLVITLVKRLAKFGMAQRHRIGPEVRLFETFNENIQHIIEACPHTAPHCALCSPSLRGRSGER